MGTAYFETQADWNIYGGERSYSFNPSGDVTGATVTEVRFAFYINYNGGAAVDLGDVDIWIQSPDGERDRIYYNWDGWGNDTDDGNDSDASSDYDISFWGTDSVSKTPLALDGNPVNGTWKLIVDNGTGKTLKNTFLKVWVDYDSPANLKVKDIQILGTQQVDQPVYIQTWIENTGDKYYLSPVTIEYLVEGTVVGSSYLPLGLPSGQVNLESQLHVFDKIGTNDVKVRIVSGNDVNTSDNTLTKSFTFDHNEPDLKVTDIHVVGTTVAGSPHFIIADVQNVGNAIYWDDILLEYLVNDVVIGTQTIGISGIASGLLPGAENSETEIFEFPDFGSKTVTVRIAGANDFDSSNDELSQNFNVSAPDLVMSDIRVRGGWDAGDEVEISAYVENIGDGAWDPTLGTATIKYYVSYDGVAGETYLGSDALSLGLLPGTGDLTWESHTFTLANDGPFTVRAEVGGPNIERDTTNNSWSMQVGHDRSASPQKTLANSPDDVALAMLMARTAYGDDGIPSAWHGSEVNGLTDDYHGYFATLGWTVLTDAEFGDLYRPVDGLSKFWNGGLFSGDQGIAFSDPAKWQAQGLVTEGVGPDGKKTMTLTFRGTDAVDALYEAGLGQAFSGDGLHDYYQSMRPLIDAALGYANDPLNGIEKVVVSGHSLGGATTDLFALIDAHRLDANVDLTVVSFASAGLDQNVLTDTPLFKGMSGQFNDVYVDTVTVGGSEVATGINPPPYYIGISHKIDPVTFSEENPLPLPFIPNWVLDSNLTFDGKLTAIETPNIDNTDFKIGTFGAGHNGGLYWANVSQILSDPLMTNYSGERIIVGVTDYASVPDVGGQPFEVFTDYTGGSTSGYDNDSGSRKLSGDASEDFILGFSGDDEIDGEAGADLLSGGSGADLVMAGAGYDLVDGGNGNDTVYGQGGEDTVYGGAGDDDLSGGSGRDQIHGDTGNDTIVGGLANDSINGGGGDDSLTGSAGADTISGGDGNDIVSGQGFTDTLLGGAGNDSLFGGGSADVLFGEADADELYGQNAADTLEGGTGDDLLDGGAGNDVLQGGAENDTLLGSTGNDRLYGGEGSDIFRFSSNHGTLDRIYDFEDGIDLIEFSINTVSDITDLTIIDVFAGVDVSYGTGLVRIMGASEEDFSNSDFLFS